MLLWDGDLLNWNHLGSANSLENWGLSHSQDVTVSYATHDYGNLFASDSLTGHWTLDAVMPVQSAQHLVDSAAASPADVSSAGADSAPAAVAQRHSDLSSLAFVLPTVLKAEEPFAMPLVSDVSSFDNDIGSIGDYSGHPQVHAIRSLMASSDPFILSIG